MNFKLLQEIMNRHDPIGLIAMAAPKDEYDAEAAKISGLKVDSVDELAAGIYQVFCDAFDEATAGSKEKYLPLAEEIWINRDQILTRKKSL